MRRLAIFTLALLFAACGAIEADDGAASIAAGGLIVMKRETRVVMAKEVLSISPTHVVVDYEFRNDSAQDVTTEVAFPIPAYKDDPDQPPVRALGFDDFKLWVDGKRLRFTVETRAFVGAREVTQLLAELRVDVATFGGDNGAFDYPYKNPQIDALTRAQRARLVAAKAIDSDTNHVPRWRVEKKYHWTQVFPARGVVKVRHEYAPLLGSSNTVDGSFLQTGKAEKYEELPSLCPTLSLLRSLRADVQDGHSVQLQYVDFILTTANTWQRPIEDFTLNVERASPVVGSGAIDKLTQNYVSFCWDGPVVKLNAQHFSAHLKDFVPKKEVRVGFLLEYAAKQ